jgi:hypothetical protein
MNWRNLTIVLGISLIILMVLVAELHKISSLGFADPGNNLKNPVSSILSKGDTAPEGVGTMPVSSKSDNQSKYQYSYPSLKDEVEPRKFILVTGRVSD